MVRILCMLLLTIALGSVYLLGTLRALEPTKAATGKKRCHRWRQGADLV